MYRDAAIEMGGYFGELMDFIDQEDLLKNRAGQKIEFVPLGSKHLRPSDIRRHEVGGALNPSKVQV